MRKRKNIGSTLKKTCALILFFMVMSHEVSANKIELADSVITIFGVGNQQVGDKIFSAKSDTLPARIRIDELAITYSGNKTNILTIVKNGTDTLYNKKSKNCITFSEIDGGKGLYIDTNAEYLFSHGEKIWKLKFYKSGNDTTNTEFWLIILILAVLTIALCVFYCRKRGFFKFGNPNSDFGGDESEEEAPIDNVDEPFDSDDTIKEAQLEETKNAAQDELLNSILTVEKTLSVEEKKEILRAKLRSGEKYEKEIQDLKEVLGYEKDCQFIKIIEGVKQLRDKECDPSDEERRDKENTSIALINAIKEIKDKTLNSLIEKAKKDIGTTKNANYDILLRFFKLLSLKISASSSTPVTKKNEDFESLMRRSENQLPMKKWMIEKIKDEGYSGLNKNDTINVFQEIADLLNAASKSPEPSSPEEIIDDTISRDKFTDEQRKKLLSRLIEKINKEIYEDSKKFDSTTSLDDFVVKVAEKAQTPSTQEEAEDKVRNNNLKAVNKLFNSDMTDFDQKSLENAFNSAIVKRLNNKLKGLDAKSYDDAMAKLSVDVKNSKAVSLLLKDYNASEVSELTKAVKEKNASDLLKSTEKKLNELLPDKEFDSIHKVINALIGLAEGAKKSNDDIADELEEKITLRNSKFVAPEDRDVNKLIKEYCSLVDNKETELNSTVKNKDREIQKLETSLTEKEIENSTLSDKNKDLMSETDTLIENLHNGADNIKNSWRTILNACSDSDESQCNDIEDRLLADLEGTVDRFKSYRVRNDVKPADARKRIQALLVEELSKENNPINTVCRYYAYSRLPFMTDTSREYGITFNRKNMYELFHSIESLYVQFGINLNIPNLFVAGIEEGNFVDLTGKSYGDLDNLCHNSRNHFDNIDSNAKPSNVIVDVVNVGYAVDGNEVRLSSVLTY